MKLKDAIANHIKDILKEKKITQYELYKRSGVPQSTISTILNGDIKTIKISTLYDICSGLEIELKDFFNNECFSLKNLED